MIVTTSPLPQFLDNASACQFVKAFISVHRDSMQQAWIDASATALVALTTSSASNEVSH
jgi:hypothetical protein